MATKRATLIGLAQELQLAPSTVSRALNGHPAVNEATRKRVQALAYQRHYRPNHLATALRQGKSNLIGVLVPKIDGRFFASVVQGITAVARAAGYHVLICESDERVENERLNVAAMLEAQVDGILASLARTTLDIRHFHAVQQRGIPLVFFDRVLEGPQEASAVLIDDFQGAYLMTQHLLAQGARRIAHLGGPRHLNIYRQRYRGYCEALLAAGLAVDDALVRALDMSPEAVAAATHELLAQAPRPDALFGADDFVAFSALQVAKSRGLRVPADLLLAGFSNEPFTSYIEPMLSTVDQHSAQLGESAGRLLLELLRPAAGRPAPLRQVVLQPELLVRASTARPRPMPAPAEPGREAARREAPAPAAATRPAPAAAAA